MTLESYSLLPPMCLLVDDIKSEYASDSFS